MEELPVGEYHPPTSFRFKAQGLEPIDDRVPLEEPLEIEVSGRSVAVLMRTPGADKALALGYCLSEGLIGSLGEVLLIHHCGSGAEHELLPEGAEPTFGSGNRVRMLLAPEAARGLAERPTRWVFSGCAGVDAATLGEALHVGHADLRLPPALLLQAVTAIAERQEQYRTSGGIHAAALFGAGGELAALAEDVGRHNAADKAIGMAALAGALPAALLVATGRASSDIIAKAARLGIPVVASFSSTTSLGVRLAEAAGITLIGYLRRNRFMVYTHPERIAADVRA